MGLELSFPGFKARSLSTVLCCLSDLYWSLFQGGKKTEDFPLSSKDLFMTLLFLAWFN